MQGSSTMKTLAMFSMFFCVMCLGSQMVNALPFRWGWGRPGPIPWIHVLLPPLPPSPPSIPPPSYSQTIVNAIDYGAVGDGETDDSKAFLKAWEHVCNATEKRTVYQVPAKMTFLLNPITLRGPCKSSLIHVQIEGQLVAPKTIQQWGECSETWISFENIQGLHVTGSGQLDGRGSFWWNKNPTKKCGRPTALKFHSCSSLLVDGLSHVDSPRNHIGISKCENAELSNLHITAPEDSPNTDGVDIASSTNVRIHNCHISTGDDCIAINDGSSFVNIESVECGRGHGISVGSLGEDGEYNTVEAVYVKNCTFNETQNGVRIKTWERGSGYARNITYKDITFYNTHNPIIIDQHYVNKLVDSLDEEAAVRVSDVTYWNMQGTSATEEAISLLCSNVKPCVNIKFHNTTITRTISGQQTKSHIENAEVKGLH